MKPPFRIFILPALVIFSSCSQRECDCNILFPDDDSVISISAVKDSALEHWFAVKFKSKWKQKAMLSQIEKVDREYETLNRKIELRNFDNEQQYFEAQDQLGLIELEQITLRYEQEKLKLKQQGADVEIKARLGDPESDYEPFTGTCIMKSHNGMSDSLRGEFENGKLVGKWMPAK